MPHIVIAVTSPLTATMLLKGQLSYLRQAGWEVTLLCSSGEDLDRFAVEQGVSLITVTMQREPAPLADLRAVIAITRALKAARPDIISFGTPKAALLCSLASFLAGIRVRVYLLRGLRAEGLLGFKRKFAIFLERVTSSLSTEVYCVSSSLKETAIHTGAVHAKKARLIGHGGSNGIDVNKYKVSQETSERAHILRQKWSIPCDAKVIGFVGRMVIDKGLRELIDAFECLPAELDCYLVLVGMRESSNDLPEAYWEKISGNPRIRWLGLITDLPGVYQAMDLFVLPTYREGLPNVVLEASAMERPVVVSCVTGAKDAVLNQRTGLLFTLHSKDDLVRCITTYLSNSDMRTAHGSAGRCWVEDHFSNQAVWRAYEAAYREAVTHQGHSDKSR